MGAGFSRLGYEQTDAHGNHRSAFVQLIDPVGVCIQPIVWEDGVMPEVAKNEMEDIMDQPQPPSPHEIPMDAQLPPQPEAIQTEM